MCSLSFLFTNPSFREIWADPISVVRVVVVEIPCRVHIPHVVAVVRIRRKGLTVTNKVLVINYPIYFINKL